MNKPILGTNKNYDWASILTYLALVFIGWGMLFSVFYNPEEPFSFLNPFTDIGKQTIFLALALFVFLSVLTIEWNFWNTLALPIYGIGIFLLILVLIVGSEIKGAKAWFSFGFFSFQPAEIAKFGTALALSSYLSSKKHELSDLKISMSAIGLFLVPILLILLQPDAGSALVFLSFFILLYRKGFYPSFYAVGILLLLVFILSFKFNPFIVSLIVWYASYALLLFTYQLDIKTIVLFAMSILATYVGYLNNMMLFSWIVPVIGTLIMSAYHIRERNIRLLVVMGVFIIGAMGLSFGADYVFSNYMRPHQQDRINSWLRPDRCDPAGPLYNLIQSKLAIGSGGITGKGYLEGEMTKLKYVPEQSSDFIFSSVGEEFGFLGVLLVIGLFTLLCVRLVIMAERARLDFIKNYIYCIAGIIFVHFFINIGMTMGLMPIIGIPLPFLSKGGSSLLAFTVMVGVAIKMDYYRSR